MKVLVTGGAGYIGSHTSLALLRHGYEVIVVDNFSNSSLIALERVQQLAGRKLRIFETDLCDHSGLQSVFQENPEIESVIHFAALKFDKALEVLYFFSSDAYHTYQARIFSDWDNFSIVDSRNLVRLNKGDRVQILKTKHNEKVYQVELLDGFEKNKKYFVIKDDLFNYFKLMEKK